MLNFLSPIISVIIFVAVLIVSIGASFFASRFFYNSANKYFQYGAKNNMTGYQVARKMLDDNGLQDVTIQEGNVNNKLLNDNFNPVTKIITLSNRIYYGKSITAQAVAAHETGHAIQHKNNYSFAALRLKLVPALNIVNALFLPLFLLSLFTFNPIFFLIIIAFFLLTFLFQIVTLPVEFNASKIAFKYIKNSDIRFSNAEFIGIQKVLHRAAFTYIAAAFGTFIFLAYIILSNLR